MKVSKTYANAKNGGKEYVSRDGDTYSINSFVPGVGWMGERKVSRRDVERGLRHTAAPEEVVSAILGEQR